MGEFSNTEQLEQAKAIAALQQSDKYHSDMLREVRDDVKTIKNYMEQQKGAVRIAAILAGFIGSVVTFLGQSIFNFTNKH